MATDQSVLLCDVCQKRHLNKSAEEYCPQCEEALCRECRDHHKLSKWLKSHQTITVDKYNKLPSFIKQISQNYHLEEELLEKVSTLEKTNCREIEEIITKLEDEKEKVDGIQKEVESVKLFASVCKSSWEQRHSKKVFQPMKSTSNKYMTTGA
ncbi:Hypothetical predicted protein [Mytilus galloprovincialis]|uniref:B box-type domain-containing protein n=1 Tax=Mytilus galloprovincialis TaxID=29158 RepID=A0A8B6FUE2_MYTGA|nr:Hypothetical predicted protein [Mytilus galloprovincialis]